MPLFACLALSLLPPVGGSLPVSPAITTEPPVPQSSPAAPRIAVVNTQAFGELINEYRQQVVTLQTEFRPTLDTLQRLGAEIQAEEDALQRLADQLTPDVRLKRTDDLERKKKDFKRRQEDLNEAAEKRAAILLNPVREKNFQGAGSLCQGARHSHPARCCHGGRSRGTRLSRARHGHYRRLCRPL